jgi:hypothetical protein
LSKNANTFGLEVGAIPPRVIEISYSLGYTPKSKSMPIGVARTAAKLNAFLMFIFYDPF